MERVEDRVNVPTHNPIMSCPRRAALSASTIALLSGCSVLSSDDETADSRLANIGIANGEGAAHTVAIRLDWEGERILDRTYDIPPDRPDQDRQPGVAVERVWPDEPAQFTISGKLNDEEWITLNPADRDYPDCYTAEGTIRSASVIRWFTGTSPSFCKNAQSDYENWARWNESRTE
ncbi:hypothetical protein C479_05348 [Halovivax asiaticus JCM 14624]|uniref:Uncharacterized protein n=1 Tax=Halovivax asiaticus JCM 14624 TaxID=1227490 RepID=M0BNZ3_9EURY|nr:hypothetical protein C479_05348 [Halovivax asiaticus JCM 14624]